MGEFSLTTKGWGSWGSFLSLPKDRDNGRAFLSPAKDGDHGRVFSHYRRMGIMGEFSLTTKYRDHGRVFSHYQRMGIMGEIYLTTKGWRSWESFLSLL